MLRDEEFEELSEVVSLVFVREFNLSQPDQLREYQAILEKVVNRLYRCLFRKVERVLQPDGSQPMIAYIEYYEPALEVPQGRMPYLEQ